MAFAIADVVYMKICVLVLDNMSVFSYIYVLWTWCAGGHGAWLLAANYPDLSTCVSATASWTRKEEYGDSNRFFELDASGPLVAPALKALLESSMAEFHVDRLVRNMRGKEVYIRVGAQDRTTHPWYSRRMYRLLKQADVNTSYEEVPGKEHWWWDTKVSNDGGVLNDPAMRKFYAQCGMKYDTAQQQWPCSVWEGKGHVVVDVINPFSHEGSCGVRVMQQFHSMQLSSVDMGCTGGRGAKGNDTVECLLRTNGNIRRLSIRLPQSSRVVHIAIPSAHNIRLGPYNQTGQTLYICWMDGVESHHRQPYECTEEGMDPLKEKSLASAGSLRVVYANPLVIVYGTFALPSTDITILQQLAVYHANSHNAAHHTFIRVLSDEQYLLWTASTNVTPHSAVFIGARENRVMRECCGALDLLEVNSKCAGIQCQSPVTFVASSNSEASFRLGAYEFSGVDESIVFTLPLIGQIGSTAWTGAAACIAANAIEGYQHITRLSWPVVPPMVRNHHLMLSHHAAC